MTKVPSASDGIRVPLQARSRRTLSLIVQASLQLIAERGVQGVTIQDIVDRAGSSVGSFYARFAGKEELLQYLEARVWTDARERWDAALDAQAWSSLPLEQLVTGVVDVLSHVHSESARERRAIQERPDANREHARDFSEHVRRTVRDLLLSYRIHMTHPAPDLAVDLGLAAVVGALGELEVQRGPAGTGPTEATVVRELSRLYLAYLGVAVAWGTPGKASGPVDFFDVWG